VQFFCNHLPKDTTVATRIIHIYVFMLIILPLSKKWRISQKFFAPICNNSRLKRKHSKNSFYCNSKHSLKNFQFFALISHMEIETESLVSDIMEFNYDLQNSLIFDAWFFRYEELQHRCSKS